MLADITDRDLISQFLIQKDKDALEMLISRYHQKCYEQFYDHYHDEKTSIDLCKKLWTSVLSKPKDLDLYDNFSEFLDADIDSLLKNEIGIIENVLDSVHLNYLNDSFKVKHPQKTNLPIDGLNGLTKKTVNVKHLLNSSIMRILIGVLIVAILVVVSINNFNKPKLNTPNLLVDNYMSDILKENAGFLSDNINTTIDWQYGFVIEGSNSHDAFVVGSYMIDLINLDEVAHAVEIEKVLGQLSDINSRIMNADIQTAIEYINVNTVTNKSIKNLVSSFENYYSENSEKNYFKFGKWVEFNYLHTKLALELNNTNIYSESLYKDDEFMTQFLSGGKHPNYVKQDIEKIHRLYSSTDITLDKLKQQDKLLGRLRSLLF